MIPLHYLRLFSASGTDAGDFLHGQLTADIAGLAPGEATLAAWCSPRGQVIALLLVKRREEDWLMALDRDLADDVISRLRRYILRARVGFTEFENRWLSGSLDVVPPSGTHESLWLRELKLGYEVTAEPRAGIEPKRNSAPGTEKEWKAWELRRGLSWLSPSTSERFLPQMLGLDELGAVSFSKGCYPGQEVIARARYLGKVKRKPVILELEGNADLPAGKECALSGAGIRIEGTVLDSVCPTGDVTTAIVIAAMPDQTGTSPAGEDEAPAGSLPRGGIQTLSVGDRSWPARKVDRIGG